MPSEPISADQPGTEHPLLEGQYPRIDRDSLVPLTEIRKRGSKDLQDRGSPLIP